MKPRIGNGTRRGLRYLSLLGVAELEEAEASKVKTRTAGEAKDLARAIAWIQWHVSHTMRGKPVVVPDRPRRRPRHVPMEQLGLELLTPERRGDLASGGE